jgi:hypothetical protein
MLQLCHDRYSRVSDEELREFVRSAFANRGKDRSYLRQLSRRPYDYQSSFAIELLIAEFDGGIQVPLILKDLSPHAMLDEARRVRPAELYRPEREIIVYREILSDASLGTAMCYGGFIDRAAKHFWLLLEKVAADELYTIGDFTVWCRVASWLARAHSQFAESSKVEQLAALLRYDRSVFNSSIQRAVAKIERRVVSTEVEPARISKLWRICDTAVGQICALPATLIHGDFYPSNILVAANERDYRICPVDWEMAGVGPGMFDLAALVSGKWSESERLELASAYFDALRNSQTFDDFDQFAKALLACRLLLAVGWLGWSAAWEPPVMHQHDWLAEALSISDQLQELG